MRRGSSTPSAHNRLRRLWRAVEVSVVALEQSGIVPAAGNGCVDGGPNQQRKSELTGEELGKVLTS
jgi:hypothetical protein